MRGFRCVPLSLIRARALNDLTSFVRDVMWSALLAQDERHCLPFETCELRSAIFPNRPFVGLGQIAVARDKLVALGVWLHKTTPRKEWLEIHPDYRHSEGQNETSYGEEPRAAQQGQLPFPPAVVPSRAQKINGLRVESEQSKANDSLPAKTEPPALPEPAPPGNRDAGHGRMESKKGFARTAEQLCATPLGRRLHDYIRAGTHGGVQLALELQNSGARWLSLVTGKDAERLAELLDTHLRVAHTRPTARRRVQELTSQIKEYGLAA